MSSTTSGDDAENSHAPSTLLAPVPRSRSASKEGFETRCFMRANRVVSAYDRQPFECVGYCSRHFVGEALGVVQHYTKECIWEDRNRFGAMTFFFISMVRGKMCVSRTVII